MSADDTREDSLAAARRAAEDGYPLASAQRIALQHANAACLRDLGPVLAGVDTAGRVVPVVNFAMAPGMTGEEARAAAERMIAREMSDADEIVRLA